MLYKYDLVFCSLLKTKAGVSMRAPSSLGTRLASEDFQAMILKPDIFYWPYNDGQNVLKD